MSEKAFPEAIEKVLGFEGGYGNDPNDPGGETNYGISKRAYPYLDIPSLSREDAIAIYHRDYWLKPGFDTLPDLIGAKMLDLGVNMGTRSATKLLQRAINHAGWAPPVLLDGRLGPLTRAATNGVEQMRLLAAIRVEARNRYLELIADNPALYKFRAGWLRRAAA